MFYIQYDDAGAITGTVSGSVAPEHPRQLVRDTWVETEGKRVDLSTLELVDVEPTE